MRMVDIIDTKRNGGVLSDEQLQFFVDGVVNGTIPDYQISALLMAIYFQDMTKEEQTSLTMKMMESGERLDLSRIPGIKVDKHSTGGVGDKVSLPLAAMVAATGIPVPMISGRGLGHTGGTLDKLEAIPGFRVELSEDEFINQVAKEMIIENIPEKCLFHDWWTYMICSGLGTVLYNDETVVKYRRFQKNATAEGQSILKIFLWRIEKLVTDNGMKDIKIQQQEYKNMFYEKLSEEKRKILDLFVQDKYHFLKAIKKACYPQKLRRKFTDDCMIRILFIFGIL